MRKFVRNFKFAEMAVNFYLDARVDKRGDAPIRVSISIRGVRLLTSSGHKICPAKWDANRQLVRKGATNASGVVWSAINSALNKIRDHYLELEGDCIAQGVHITVADLKADFARTFGRYNRNPSDETDSGDNYTIFDYIDIFIKEMGESNGWTASTCQKFSALKNHLSAFNETLSFEDLSEDNLSKFIVFLREDLNMRNSTIAKQVAFLKWFLRWATTKGVNSNRAFESFAPKFKTAPKKVVFLEWDELMRVFRFEVPDNGVEVRLRDCNGKTYVKVVHDAAAIAKTRDIFCFCCFTSLRYSDAQNLKKTDIQNGAITITTVKTADTLTIELNKYALEILEKYLEQTMSGGYVFPRITNQRMNVYLKDLCELCGINQPITQTYYKGAERHDETAPKFEMMGTHAGRRTFICNALMLGIPAETVMKWTGHSDYKAMKPYIDITNSAKAKAMAKFNDLTSES